RALLGAGRIIWHPAADAGIPARRPAGSLMRSGTVFFLIALAVAAVLFGCGRAINNDYVFFAGYTVLQFIVLATAWNILGGYTGYVNFGSAAFFALGAYSTVALHKFSPQVYKPWIDELPDSIAATMHSILDPVVQTI